MCFDESEAIDLFPFPVPFIKQPIEEMAKYALKLLIDQIEKKVTNDQKLFLEAELMA